MTPTVRRLLHFALLYTCVEGLVINMTFPSKLGFIVKDAVLVAAYLSLFSNNQGQSFGSLSRVRVPVMFFAAIQTLYLLLPIGLPLLARSVGWKMRLLYIPVMFLAYRYIRSFEDYRKLAMLLVWASIPVSIFGIYLYFAGPTFLRSIGGTYSAMVYSTTGVWRVPGTFTSPGQYGLYLTFNVLLCLSLMIWGRSTVRSRIVIWTGLGVSLVAMLASGSRTPLVLVGACGGLTIISLRKVGRLISTSVLLYAVFAVAFATLGAGVSDRVDSIASTEHIERFQKTYFGQMFIGHLGEEPMGLGLGSATIGARHFTEFRQIVFIESYFGLVAVETGFLGLFGILWISAAVVTLLWRQRAVMKDSGDPAAPWHVVALFAVMIVALSPVGTPLDAAPGNVYFWLSVGICAKLYDLERWRRAEALGMTPESAQPVLSPYPPVPPPIPSLMR